MNKINMANSRSLCTSAEFYFSLFRFELLKKGTKSQQKEGEKIYQEFKNLNKKLKNLCEKLQEEKNEKN